MPRYSKNQLFIGRLPRSCRERDLEDIFDRYGKLLRCDVKTGPKMSYGFIEYEDPRDAEDAIDGEDGRDMRGNSIVVEWARGPKYNFHQDKYRHDNRGRSPRRDYRRRSRSRSRGRRSRSRERRSRSRDRQSGSHDRRSRSRDRRDRSRDRRSESNDRRSRSGDRNSRSRSEGRRSRSRD